MKNIENVALTKKCCSCGICAGICPEKAISMGINSKTGELLPNVSAEKCIECGLCLKVCPGLSNAERILSDNPSDHKHRQCSHLESHIGYIEDSELLENCTSGGIVSELVRTLLSVSAYESAFLVGTNQYANFVTSSRVTAYLPGCSKSRYIAVSHEKAAEYMLSHKNERIIIVAVGCAVTGFRNLIRQYRLNADNYLLIGLFCDKVMTYHIWDYFGHKYNPEGCLTGLDFRNKLESGWPGDVRLYFSNNESMRVDRKERMQVKNIFQNERCMYCTDKLNESSDISVGDNYTGKFAPKEGSSSIIVRTDTGKRALDQIRDKCFLTPVSVEELYTSQQVNKKQKNMRNAKIKYKNMSHDGISVKNILHYTKSKLMLKAGHLFPKAPLLIQVLIKLKSTVAR